jgi:hypothetical protein
VRAAANWLELHPKQWRRVRDGDELRGLDGAKLLLFGAYRKHPRYEYIMEVARRCRTFVSTLEDLRL